MIKTSPSLVAPFPYFGGKRRAAELVWSRFGGVHNYVEPFCGSLAVLLKSPIINRTETVNDLNGFVTNFWRAITEGAKNHLIEVLRLNPGEPWGWVVLGNLYAKNEKDWATAEKFLRRALELAPNDPWALNGLAAMSAQRGQIDEAVKLFEQAISSNADLPNPYYGLGVTFHRSGKPALAVRALDQLFRNARMQDSRSKTVSGWRAMTSRRSTCSCPTAMTANQA